MIDAKLSQIPPFTMTLKDGAVLRDLPGTCLLMGLGSLEVWGGQPLCYVFVRLTVVNRLLSRGY